MSRFDEIEKKMLPFLKACGYNAKKGILVNVDYYDFVVEGNHFIHLYLLWSACKKYRYTKSSMERVRIVQGGPVSSFFPRVFLLFNLLQFEYIS